MAADDVALEHLDALAVALGDAVVNLHGIADVELGKVLLLLLFFDCANDIHLRSFYMLVPKPLRETVSRRD